MFVPYIALYFQFLWASSQCAMGLDKAKNKPWLQATPFFVYRVVFIFIVSVYIVQICL